MSLVAFDFLPEAVTPGEMCALAAATDKGWINPPLYNCLQPEGARTWRTVHLRYLQRRGLCVEGRYRRDGMWCLRLNAAGLALKELLS